MKKVIACMMSMMLLVGCSSQSSETTTIRIGMLPSLGSLPFLYAKDKGMFEKENLNVEIVTFRSAAERDAALLAGELDASSNDLVNVLLMKEQNVPLVVTGRTDEEFRVITNEANNTKTVDQFNNSKVGLSNNTVIEFLIDEFAKEHSLTLEKVPFPKVPERKAALESNQIQLSIMPDPFNSLVLANKGKEVQLMDQDYTVLSFKEDFMTANEKAVKAFNKVYKQAQKEVTTLKYDDYKQLFVDNQILTADNVDLVKPMVYHEYSLPSEESFKNIQAWCMDKKIITKESNYADVVKGQ